MFSKLFCVLSVISLSLFAEEKNETAKVSEAFGHLIGKNLESMGVKFDADLVAKGLKDAVNGQSSPMTEAECIEAISLAQETAFKEQAENNLSKAEAFLKSNAKTKGVVSLEDGKIQYKVEQKGTGEKVIPNSSPVIRYVGKSLDGSIFDQSKEAEMLCLDDAIPGLRKGLVGMKEGEKRIFYLHPEFAYGTQGLLPPNSLLTFEIEVIKAQSLQEEHSEPLIIESNQETKPSAQLDTPAIR